MKYKIKIVTYLNGRQSFFSYFKKGWFWKGLDYLGEPCYAYESNTREGALSIIDKHYCGNSTIVRIHFEYIEK